MLYSNKAPIGAVTTMVPVGTAQVGCKVTLAVGTAGTVGTALTLILVVEAEIQVGEAARRVVKVWLPGNKPAKVTLAW